MDKKKNKKKFEILTERIIQHIKENKLEPNDRLPTLREMIDEWNFSYATVHRTLIEMENMGLISRHQGKGLFVNRVDVDSTYKQVALVIPSLYSEYKIFIDILAGVKAVLEKKKISLMVSISNMSHEKEKVTIERLMSRHIDGMIIFLENNYRQDYSHIVRLKESNFPFVLIDRFIPELDTDFVVVDNRIGMLKICSYLRHDRKCNKVIFVKDLEAPTNVSSSEEKLAGFKEASKIFFGQDGGEVVTLEQLLSKLDQLKDTRDTFGICLNHDEMIPVLLDRLQNLGKSVPPNCNLFGYNNSFETPIYPTVEQFNQVVGMKAAEILIERMENPNAKPSHARIEPKLIIPDSNGNFYMEN